MDVPNGTFLPPSNPGEKGGLYEAERSYSNAYVGTSDWAGVNDTRGGAADTGAAERAFGLSEAVVRDEKVDVPVGTEE